jgi:hypothetical protein
MPVFYDLFTNSKVRTKAVTEKLKETDASVLFLVTVDQFKKKPSKKKAVAIYDVFLGPNKVWPPIGHLDEDKADHQGILGNLKGSIDLCSELHTKARSMNPFERVATSRDRVVAPGLFDAVITASNLIGTSGQGVVAGFVPSLDMGKEDDKPGFTDWQVLATKGKKLLKEAGFDVADLGMRNV